MTVRATAIKSAAAAAFICLVISIVITKWVGDATLFASELEAKRMTMHTAILRNEAPNGATWSAVGANGLNIRVLTVWCAEQIHLATSIKVLTVYRLIDLASLFVALMLTWRLLQRWFAQEQATAGVLLLASLLPLTMFFGAFHPWDRPSMVLWVVMILLACQGRLLTFLPMYLLAIVVKFDAIAAVALPFFLQAGRIALWRVGLQAAGLFSCGVAVLVMLLWSFPEGQEARPLDRQFLMNLRTARALGLTYPPLLAHGLLLFMGAIGWRSAAPELRRLWLCGASLLLPHILFTNVVEVRAQVGTLLCMLPLAVHGLGTAMSRAGEPQCTGSGTDR